MEHACAHYHGIHFAHYHGVHFARGDTTAWHGRRCGPIRSHHPAHWHTPPPVAPVVRAPPLSHPQSPHCNRRFRQRRPSPDSCHQRLAQAEGCHLGIVLAHTLQRGPSRRNLLLQRVQIGQDEPTCHRHNGPGLVRGPGAHCDACLVLAQVRDQVRRKVIPPAGSIVAHERGEGVCVALHRDGEHVCDARCGRLCTPHVGI